MSTQPTLADFESEPEVQDVREYERTLDGRGAVYSGSGLAPDIATDEPTRVCLDCGHDVPNGIARVLGDNDGNVPRCPDCTDGVSQWFVAVQRGHGQGYEKGRSE